VGVVGSGVGVAGAVRGDGFERVARVAVGGTAGAGGAGSGLGLVKKLVELHAGRVEMKSEPGVGTPVTVSLPWEG